MTASHPQRAPRCAQECGDGLDVYVSCVADLCAPKMFAKGRADGSLGASRAGAWCLGRSSLVLPYRYILPPTLNTLDPDPHTLHPAL